MRLLIVEDEADFAQNLKKLLELRGFAADWLADGEKALNRIRMYHKEYDALNWCINDDRFFDLLLG